LSRAAHLQSANKNIKHQKRSQEREELANWPKKWRDREALRADKTETEGEGKKANEGEGAQAMSLSNRLWGACSRGSTIKRVGHEQT